MTFWIEKSNMVGYNKEELYDLHYGHSETSVTVAVSKQSLVELKTLLQEAGF